MKGSFYTLSYAAILGSVCALLLTAAAKFSEPYKKANAIAEEKRNILAVLKIPFEADASSKELVEIFKANVEEQQYDDLTIYAYVPSDAGGEKLAVAVPFFGPGLWGPIKGFIALEPDMRTIRGITFYEQEETPGLGGEIASSGFREQFHGKYILDEAGNAGIVIGRVSGTPARNQVHAITGATMTCDKVEAMLNKTIKDIVKQTKSNG